MTLYSYIVARDFGFAPNPFFGVCTLATCKSPIRERAQVGDWVVGTGSKGYGLADRLVFAMKVESICTFEQYWGDLSFQLKKPNLHASLMQAVGDNIYHRSRDGAWVQADSHHSHPGGVVNQANLDDDTKADRVLISKTFGYWGGDAIEIPERFKRNPQGIDICRHEQGYKSNFPPEFVRDFEEWFLNLPDMKDPDAVGYFGDPAEFSQMLERGV